MIADRVGVTPPSIYLHFDTKAHVIYACCGLLFEQFSEHVDAATADVDNALDRFVAMGKAYVRFGLENPELYRVLFMTVPSEQPDDYDVQEMLEKGGFMDLVSTVSELVTSGHIRESDPFKASLGAWAMVHGITSLMISHDRVPWPDVEAMIDHQIHSYLHGLVSAQTSPHEKDS